MIDNFAKKIKIENDGTANTSKMTKKNKKMLLKFMNESQLDQLLKKESNDFKDVLQEFYKAIEMLQTKLKPVIDKI